MNSPFPFHRWRSGEIGLSIVLGLQIAIMFVIAPLAATGLLPGPTVDLFRLGLAAVAVLLVTPNRLGAAVVGITFLISLLLSLGFRTGMSALVVNLERLAAVSAFDLAIVAVVAHRVFAGGRVSLHRIMGAVILYLSIGLIFANIYRVCTLLLHPSFSTFTPGSGGALSQLLYFSLTTLTTTGFGDIAPVHPFVRSLANLESVIGQLFPATLLARLVTLHARPEREEPET
jgi:hypothetical protein